LDACCLLSAFAEPSFNTSSNPKSPNFQTSCNGNLAAGGYLGAWPTELHAGALEPLQLGVPKTAQLPDFVQHKSPTALLPT